MPSEKEYERQIAEMMKAKAEEDGLDPSKIDSSDVHVDTTGPTLKFGYRGATVSLPAPSRAAIDQWFQENGKYIAGALTMAAGVVLGNAIKKR